MKVNLLIVAILSLFLISCGSNNEKKEEAKAANPNGLSDFEMENGIGPIKEKIVLAAIDTDLAKKGEDIYVVKCAACHKLDERFIGPPQRYTTDRRTPEYILNMVLNPDEMTKKHPTGKELLGEYLAPMTNMNLTLDQAKEVLEYLRSIAKEGHDKGITAAPVFKNKQ